MTPTVRTNSLSGRVLAHLATHPGATIHEISADMGEPTALVGHALRRHADRKLVVSSCPIGANEVRWTLARAPRQPLTERVLTLLASLPTLTRADMIARFPKERPGSISQALNSLEQHGRIVVVYGSRPLVFTLSEQAAQ